MAVTQKPINANTALAGALTKEIKTPETGFSANNLSQEASNETSALARAFGQVAGSGKTQEREAFADTKNPAQDFDDEKTKKATLETEKEAQELQEHLARIKAADSEAKIAFSRSSQETKTRVAELQRLFLQTAKPKVKIARMKETANSAAIDIYVPESVNKGQGATGLWEFMISEAMRENKSVASADRWIAEFKRKKAKNKNAKPGAGLAEAKGQIEITTEVQGLLSDNEGDVGGE